jgi:hypothetical protein
VADEKALIEGPTLLWVGKKHLRALEALA